MRGREEIEEDAQDGEGRDGEDHAGQPTYLPAADHGQEYDYRVQVERLALDARREEVALELLDQDVGHHRQRGDGRGFERVCQRAEVYGFDNERPRRGLRGASRGVQ